MRHAENICSDMIEQHQYPLLVRSGAYDALANAAENAPIETPERRGDDRSKVRVYRAAVLRWHRFEGLCLIRNISPGGLMAKVHAHLDRGERVTVEIRSGCPIEGTIVWVNDGHVGMQFDERIDVLETLNGQPAGRLTPTPRMPRLRIACPVQMIVDGARFPTVLIDLSQAGAKVEADFVRPDMHVTLAIPGLEPKRAIVRWAEGGRAGLAFHAPIAFDPLAQWALERQSSYGMG